MSRRFSLSFARSWLCGRFWPLTSLVAGAALMALAATAALAVQPDEMMKDPVLEGRAREVSRNLRCVVCQNESIDESNAELARDLRLLVRDRLGKGDSNEQATSYIVDRYGDYVLLKPPFKLSTYALWFGPLVFALLAAWGGWRFFARRDDLPAAGEVSATAEAAAAGNGGLSDSEQKRLQSLMAAIDNGEVASEALGKNASAGQASGPGKGKQRGKSARTAGDKVAGDKA